MTTQRAKNKKYLFTILFALFLFCGCSNIDNPQRIDGIINDVYTNYETDNEFNKTKSYLIKKVNNKEISELTSVIIEKCLSRSFKKQ